MNNNTNKKTTTSSSASSKSKKQKENQLEGYNPKRFTIIKLVYTLLSVLNIIVVIASFGKIGFALNDARIATECIGTINSKVISSSSNLFSIVLDISNENLSYEDKMARIKVNEDELWTTFGEIDDVKKEFDSIKRLDEKAKKKVDQAWSSISEYRNALEEFDAALNDEDPAVVSQFTGEIYRKFEQIEPLMNNARALIDEAAKIQKDASYDMFVSTAQSVVWVLLLLIIIFVVGIMSLAGMQRSAKHTAIELKKKNDEIEAFSKKLFTNREKMKVNSHINPLTGLKNRSAMDEDLTLRLESENFHIVNFDYDNFRNFNETFGRDFGDEFLVTVANKLKADYSKYAEIYHLTQDEFCFVFNSDVTADKINSLVKGIKDAMCASYTIFNIAVQLTISGCICDYHAGDYMNINSLFIKIDKTMNEAKEEGGGSIIPVK